METGSGELVFLIRMRRQGGETPSAPHWRGSVQEVASGERRYVGHTRDIAEFIDARVAEYADRSR